VKIVLIESPKKQGRCAIQQKCWAVRRTDSLACQLRTG